MVDSLLVMVASLAGLFLEGQGADGSLGVGPLVQRHLKAQIGLVMAAGVTGREEFAEAAARDLDFVLGARVREDGGVVWSDSLEGPYFDCHQSWFLLASELVLEARGGARGPEWVRAVRDRQRWVRAFSLGLNSAGEGFLEANRRLWGVPFAFRSLEDSGDWQAREAWVGAYEVGAALGAAAVCAGPLEAEEVAGGLAWFVEDRGGGWIRARVLGASGWVETVPRDWKFSLELAEGALLDRLAWGPRETDGALRAEVARVLRAVQGDGRVEGVPDEFGVLEYELGLVLSVCGLAAVAYRGEGGDLGVRALVAGRRVVRWVGENPIGAPDEAGAVLLRGLSRMAWAEGKAPGGVGAFLGEGLEGAAGHTGAAAFHKGGGAEGVSDP